MGRAAARLMATKPDSHLALGVASNSAASNSTSDLNDYT